METRVVDVLLSLSELEEASCSMAPTAPLQQQRELWALHLKAVANLSEVRSSCEIDERVVADIDGGKVQVKSNDMLTGESSVISAAALYNRMIR